MAYTTLNKMVTVFNNNLMLCKPKRRTCIYILHKLQKFTAWARTLCISLYVYIWLICQIKSTS